MRSPELAEGSEPATDIPTGWLVRCGGCGGILSWTDQFFDDAPADKKARALEQSRGNIIEDHVLYEDFSMGCRCEFPSKRA